MHLNMCLLGMHVYKHVSLGNAFTGASAATNAAKDGSVRIALKDVAVRNASRNAFERNAIGCVG